MFYKNYEHIQDGHLVNIREMGQGLELPLGPISVPVQLWDGTLNPRWDFGPAPLTHGMPTTIPFNIDSWSYNCFGVQIWLETWNSWWRKWLYMLVGWIILWLISSSVEIISQLDSLLAMEFLEIACRMNSITSIVALFSMLSTYHNKLQFLTLLIPV